MSEENFVPMLLPDGTTHQLLSATPFDRRFDLKDGWARSLLHDVVFEAQQEGKKITASILIENSSIYAFNLARLARFAAKHHYIDGLVDAVCDLMRAVIAVDIHYVQPGTVARFTLTDPLNPYNRLSSRPHPDDSDIIIESIFHDDENREASVNAAIKLTNCFRECLAAKDPVDIMLLMGRITTAKERNTTAPRILTVLPDALVFLNTAHPGIVPDKLIEKFRSDIRQADLSKYGQGLQEIGRAGTTGRPYSLA